MHHLPLDVVTVHPAPARPATEIFWGIRSYPENSFDPELARAGVQQFVDKVAHEIGETAPEVTVSVVTGDATEELVKASQDADMLVVGISRQRRVHQAPDGFSEQPSHAPRGLPRRGRPRASLGSRPTQRVKIPGTGINKPPNQI